MGFGCWLWLEENKERKKRKKKRKKGTGFFTNLRWFLMSEICTRRSESAKKMF